MAFGCDEVRRYLDSFTDRRSKPPSDLEAVSDHVAACASCYSRLQSFFRTVELPESTFLRETLDELALSIYNLAKAIIRDRPPANARDSAENVRITEEGAGSEAENLQAGVEMIEDAEDYTGSSRVGDLALSELRDQLSSAEGAPGMKIDLALSLFRRLTTLQSRYLFKAWNWIGVLHYQKEDWSDAEQAFLRVLTAEDGAREVRSFAHCNLAYVHKHRGDLDRAVRAAGKSAILAEEDGQDPYFGQVAELYFRLLRGSERDPERARDLLERILGKPGARRRFVEDLRSGPNAPMLQVFQASPLASQFPELQA